MNSKKEVQHVYLVGAKSLGAYGGYETFVYKLTEYHQNKENIKYHVACKANGDGCMDESKFDGVTKINDHEFEFHNAHCFKIDVPQIGPAQAIYYDVAALKACCEHIEVIAVFGRHCDKLLVAAEIVYKGRVPVRGKGFFLLGFLIDNAAVVGGVLALRGLCKGGDGKAARQHEGGAECGQGSKDAGKAVYHGALRGH